MNQSKGFLHYLHSFRGFAIFCIVAIHVGVMPLVAMNNFEGPDFSSPLFIINEVLFHDSTIYFALISGLLFSAILSDRGWKRFFSNKFWYIFLPYLFFTALLSLGRPPEAPGEPGGLQPDVLSYLKALGMNLLYGKALTIYWYLPVLFILYAFTPLLWGIIKAKNAVQWLILPIILMPLVISRQPMSFGHAFFWQDPLYFLGAYAVGMWMGNRLEASMAWIKSKRIFLLVLVIVTFVGLFWMYFNTFNIVWQISIQESVHYINKLAIAALVMLYFKGLDTQPRWITALANDAFAIYFIHFLMIIPLLQLFVPWLQSGKGYPFNAIISIVALLVLTLLVTKGLIWVLKKIFGKRSRMFIGS